MLLNRFLAQFDAFARGELSRGDLREVFAPLYLDEAAIPDEDDEHERWRSSDDELSLLWRLVYLVDMDLRPEPEIRQDVQRVLRCFHTSGDAEVALRLFPLIVDQDRLRLVLRKHENGIISRTGLLSMVSESLYPREIKAWLTSAGPGGLNYLSALLHEEDYLEAAKLLFTHRA